MSRKWSPYVSNGGNTIAFCYKDSVIMGCDTRLSQGFSILSRQTSRIYQLTDKVYFLGVGMQVDCEKLQKLMKFKIQNYQHLTGHQPDVYSVARLLAITLYSRRFFFYYCLPILAGLDKNNVPVVYDYDPLGCYNQSTYASAGSSRELLQPVLDAVLKAQNQSVPVTLDKENNYNGDPMQLAKDLLERAAERDIYLGDKVLVYKLSPSGLTSEELNIRYD